MKAIRYIDYLERNGGNLRVSMTRTKWPDGTTTNHVWQYAANGIEICAAKTAKEAICMHRDALQERRSKMKGTK